MWATLWLLAVTDLASRQAGISEINFGAGCKTGDVAVFVMFGSRTCKERKKGKHTIKICSSDEHFISLIVF